MLRILCPLLLMTACVPASGSSSIASGNGAPTSTSEPIGQIVSTATQSAVRPSVTTTPSIAPPTVARECPVTLPPPAPFVPPAPYPPQAPYGNFWHGSEKLWLALPPSGAWAQLQFGDKMFWWSNGYTPSQEPQPALTVTGKRLDGDAPTFKLSRATNAHHKDFGGWAMLTGVKVPTPGCWEITGEYRGAKLSFVVWVGTGTATPEPQRPSTATPVPNFTPPAALWGAPLPTANPTEQVTASETRLYLAAFQWGNIAVVDPKSGHALHNVPVSEQHAGMAVSPDGKRLYVVDGANDGQLRVFDTQTWQVIHREPVKERALLLGGNPLGISPDGRWLFVEHYSYAQGNGWVSVFDTRESKFIAPDLFQEQNCPRPLQIAGNPNASQFYAQCADYLLAYDSATLEQAWKSYAPNQSVPALALSLDGSLLYGVYPKNANGCDNAPSGLTLVIWETKTGQVTREIDLDRQMHVPQATCGRGGAAYLTMSRDGTNLFLVWEDKLWRLETGDLRVTHELRLPFAVDGIALSVDGRELYLLPSTSGDLRVRGRGMMTVNTHLFQLIRQAKDWDKTMVQPFMFTAPAP